MGGDQRVDDGRWRVLAVREPVAGQEHEVGPREGVEAVGDVVRQAVAAGHEAGRRAAHPHLVRHAGAGREHLRGNADVERLGTLEHKDGDATQAGVWHGDRVCGHARAVSAQPLRPATPGASSRRRGRRPAYTPVRDPSPARRKAPAGRRGTRPPGGRRDCADTP
ncbi:hypothetical protein GCM10010216_62010 [Streptomyces flaveolus]|nr:hypothetical protein GCM10010216_62010 [Streptomyces flaveolus]